jgi:hypothetical protein
MVFAVFDFRGHVVFVVFMIRGFRDFRGFRGSRGLYLFGQRLLDGVCSLNLSLEFLHANRPQYI